MDLQTEDFQHEIAAAVKSYDKSWCVWKRHPMNSQKPKITDD